MSTYLVAWVVGPLELTRAGRRGRRRGARRARSRARRTSRSSRSTSARSRSRSSPTTTASRIRARSATSSRSPTSRSARWRTSAASRSARRACCSTPTTVDARRDVGRRAHDRARDRAHVVRRPRHDEVVERHLAQRGVRHVHGAPRRRRVPARVEDVGRLRGRAGPRRSTSTRSRTRARSSTRCVTPEDADGMFDLLTYQKGGSVLRMLERWLGADAFRAGVRHYLDRYQLANTETTDLWDALEEATGKPVRRIMDSWIFQPGFPVVRADDGADRRSSASPTAARRATRRCGAPGARARAHRRRSRRRGRCCSTTTPIALDAPADALVVLNAGGEGFYRVAYPRRVARPPARRRRAANRSNGSRSSTTSGRRCSRATRPRPSSSRARAGSPTRRDLVVWRVARRPPARRGPARRGRRARPLPRRGRGDRRARRCSGSVGTRRRRRRPRAPAPRARSSTCWARTPTIPRSIARAREIVERPTAPTPTCAAACDQRRREQRHRRRLRRVSCAAADDRQNPQEQLRYLYALGDFPSEELVLRACDARAHRRRPRPERAVRPPARAAQPRPRAGRVGVRARQLGRSCTPGSAAR